jgi:hypothetical protein
MKRTDLLALKCETNERNKVQYSKVHSLSLFKYLQTSIVTMIILMDERDAHYTCVLSWPKDRTRTNFWDLIKNYTLVHKIHTIDRE